MKSLKKRNVAGASIEAYVCMCNNCAGLCSCACIDILFNKESLSNSILHTALNLDTDSELSVNNYRK